MKSYLHTVYLWFAKAIEIQLVITLLSLPILLHWGLPISLLTCVGNLLLGPFLTAFLLLSSTIFFTQLLHIPNELFIIALEWLTKIWLTLMNLGPHSWLLELPRPHTLVLFFIPVATIAILHHKKTVTRIRTITLLSGLLLFVGFYLHVITRPSQVYHVIEHRNKKLELFLQNKKLTVVDHGVLSSHADPSSWVEYTLMPEMIKKCGTTKIDNLVVDRANSYIFNSVAHIAHLTQIKKLYLPIWEKQLTKGQSRAYAIMRSRLREKDSRVIRTGKKSLLINLSDTNRLNIEPGIMPKASFIQ